MKNRTGRMTLFAALVWVSAGCVSFNSSDATSSTATAPSSAPTSPERSSGTSVAPASTVDASTTPGAETAPAVDAANPEDGPIKDAVQAWSEMLKRCGVADCDPADFDQVAVGEGRTELQRTHDSTGDTILDVSIDLNFQNIAVDGDAATADSCTVIDIHSMIIDGELEDLSDLPDATGWLIENYSLELTDDGWKVSGYSSGEILEVAEGVQPCAGLPQA